MKRALLLALVAGCAVPALALAQAGPPGGGGGPRPDPETAFKAMDTNADGAVTKEEWTAAGRPEPAFARVDTNMDGKVTLDEMKAAPVRRPS